MNQKEILQPLLSILAGLLSAFIVFTVFETKTAAIAAGIACSFLIWGEMGDFFDQRIDKENKKRLKIRETKLRRRIVTFFLFLIVILFVLNKVLFGNLETADIRNWGQDLGLWGPIILISIQAAAMIFAPIPNLPFVIASGLIWGTGYGIIYAVLGQLIGSALAFAISRKFGRRYVPTIIGEKNAQKVDRLANEIGPQLIFWWRMMPISFDFAAYATGLTAIPFKTFITLAFLGSLIPTSVIVLFGDSFTRSNKALLISIGLILLSVCIPATIFYVRYKDRFGGLPGIAKRLREYLED